MSAAYRRVPSSPSTATPRAPLSAKPKNREEILARSALATKVSDKIHAAFWVGLMIFVVSKSDLIKNCLENPEVHRLSFNIGVVFLMINAVLFVYLR